MSVKSPEDSSITPSSPYSLESRATTNTDLTLSLPVTPKTPVDFRTNRLPTDNRLPFVSQALESTTNSLAGATTKSGTPMLDMPRGATAGSSPPTTFASNDGSSSTDQDVLWMTDDNMAFDMDMNIQAFLDSGSNTRIRASDGHSGSISCAGSCTCISQAVSLYEDIEVNLVWSLRKACSPTDEVMHCQKSALAQCDAIFVCPRDCSQRSEFIMLLIHMCDRILGSLDRIATSARSGITPGESLCSSEAFFPADKSFHRERLSIGRWQLDDDDKFHVVQSLLKARMNMLDRLIRNIERVVNLNYWPAHGDMLRGLQERFTQAYMSISQTN